MSAALSLPLAKAHGKRSLDRAAVVHAALMIVGSSWALGGNIGWARTFLCIFGSVGIVITIAEAWSRLTERGSSKQPFYWLWPLLALHFLVAISLFHPSMRVATVEKTEVYSLAPASALWPICVNPVETLRALWLFDALLIPGFNLVIVVRSRSALRTLLLVAAGNALILSIFGSLQKLAHAPGLFFGAVTSPNPQFFSTFIYRNHWGAFAMLMLSVCLGLLFHFQDNQKRYRDFFHSPGFAGVVGALVIAASIPLSGSRATTLLMMILLGVAVCQVFVRINRVKSQGGGPRMVPIALLSVTVACAAAGVVYVAKDDILARVETTRAQISMMQEHNSLGSRADLYRDTWHMAHDRLAFGWGMASYPRVFTFYNQQVSVDRLPVYFEDAHSDWLQLVAELGLAGALCVVLLVIRPFLSILKYRPLPPLALYSFLGCTALVVYAMIEFPFGNNAAVAAFWVCFFTAIRLVQLEARERNG